MKRFLPIRFYRISILGPLVLLAVLSLLNLAVYVLEKQRIREIAVNTAMETLRDHANMAQGIIEYSLRYNIPDLLQNNLSNLTANQYITNVVLLSPDNKILASNRKELIGEDSLLSLKKLTGTDEYSELLLKITDSARMHEYGFFEKSSGYELAAYIIPIKLNSAQFGTLIINYDLAGSIAGENDHAGFWFSLYSLTFLIIYILLTYAFHRTISLRAEKILRAIKSYTAGNKKTEIAVSGSDEIGIVSKGIRELFNRVSLTEERLTDKAEELEKVVASLAKAKDEAEHASKAKSQFLANMSHEIRTPMSVVLGAADMLIESNPDKKTQARYLTLMKKAGDNLLSLINDILDVSRVEAGILTLVKEKIDLGAALLDVIEFSSLSARQKHLDLDYSIDPGVQLECVGDVVRIKQVLNNLIANAIKYTDRGSILVTLTSNLDKNINGEILFAVKDTGIGIPESFRKSIFNNFSQADISSTKKYGGVGLGLAISRHLAEKMGGEIRYESVQGVGSQFFFTLSSQPEADLTTAEAEVNQSDETAQESGLAVSTYRYNKDRFRILLVEDNEDIKILLKTFLQDTDIEVSESENGLEAVKLVKQNIFDLIIMDIQMPVMDGYTAVKFIREWEKTEQKGHHLIAALTAYARKEDREKSFAIGFDYFLSKPIKRQELLNFISKVRAKNNRAAAATTEITH